MYEGSLSSTSAVPSNDTCAPWWLASLSDTLKFLLVTNLVAEEAYAIVTSFSTLPIVAFNLLSANNNESNTSLRCLPSSKSALRFVFNVVLVIVNGAVPCAALNVPVLEYTLFQGYVVQCTD